MTTRRSFEVATPDGDVQVAFGPNHHAGAVVAEVLMRLGRPLEVFRYNLVDNDGKPIPYGDTVASAGLRDGTTVRLEPEPTQI